MHRFFRPAMASAALAAALVVLTTGCAQDPGYHFDPRFSVNLIRPTLTDENVKALSPANREIYQLYGHPDYMRLFWNSKGELTTRAKEWSRINANQHNRLPRSWIYLDRGKEIIFTGANNYKQVDLTDQVRVICELGDPGDIQRRVIDEESYFVEWTYLDRGERYYFDEQGHQTRRAIIR